ncbi:hypothetical protein HDV05_008391, partial [Chytridiales sp. JEL 0842]
MSDMNVADLAKQARQTETKGSKIKVPMMVLILGILLSALVMVVVPLGYISLDSGQKITADLTQRVIEGVVQRTGDSLLTVFGQFAVSMYAAGALPSTGNIINNYYDNMAAVPSNTTLALIRVMEKNPISSAIWTQLRANLTGTQREDYFFPGFGTLANPCEFFKIQAPPGTICYARMWQDPKSSDLMGRIVETTFGNDVSPEFVLIKDNRPIVLDVTRDFLERTAAKPTWNVIWNSGSFSRYAFAYSAQHIIDP